MKISCVRGSKTCAAIFSGLVLTASLGFAIPTPAPLTVQIFPLQNYGTVSPNYNGQTLTNGKAYSMTARAKSGFAFTGWNYTDATGTHTNSKARLMFTNGVAFTAYFVDRQKPALTIQAPPNSTALTSPVIVVTGTAKDNDAVTNVYCQLVGQNGSTSPTALTGTGNTWNTWWVNLTLAANTNTLLVYAVDRSGNFSATNKLKLTFSAAPASLSGMAMTVTDFDQDVFVFAGSTFSEVLGVGSYTYKKTGPVAGKLVLKYTAPPTSLANDTALLQFSGTNSGTFSDAAGTNHNFTLSAAINLALPDVTGQDILLTDDNGSNQTLLSFLTPPGIVNNGHMFNVANPLVIWLSAPYPTITPDADPVGNRVSVRFTHLKNVQGNFVPVAPQTFTGTVIATGLIANTNTVTVLFDNNGFISKTDEYAPVATNNSLNILTYYYTDNSVTNGTGTFIYTNFSASGSLLQLNVAGQTSFCILTYTNVSSTNSLVAGTFYAETYGTGGVFVGTNSGSFAIAGPPVISSQPEPQAVTNGGTAAFDVAAAGSQPFTYQWQKDGTDLTDGTTGWGSVVSGSSTTNLSISSAATNDIGNYTVIITNQFGSVTSSPALLTVGVSPQITFWPQPNTITVTTGTTTNFYVAADGTAPLFYQWQFNNTNLVNDPVYAGSTTTNLTLSSVTTTNAGNYSVIITNNFGSITSSIVNLQVQ